MNDINNELKIRAKNIPIAELALKLGIDVKGGVHSNNRKVLCPFHKERTPSFNIDTNKNRFRCFGCGVSGDTIEMVKKMLNISFPKAIEYLTGQTFSDSSGHETRTRVSSPGPTTKTPKRKIYEILNTTYQLYRPIYGEALQYMHERGLSDESLNYLGVKSHHSPYVVGRSLQKLFKVNELIDSGLFAYSLQGTIYYRFNQYPILFPSFRYRRLVSFRCRSLVSPYDETQKDKRWMGLGSGIHPFFFNYDLVVESNSNLLIHASEGPTDLCSLKELVLMSYFKGFNTRFTALIPDVNSPILGYPSVSQFDEEVLMSLQGRTICMWIDSGNLAEDNFKKFKSLARRYGIKARNMRALGFLPVDFKDVNELLCHAKFNR